MPSDELVIVARRKQKRCSNQLLNDVELQSLGIPEARRIHLHHFYQPPVLPRTSHATMSVFSRSLRPQCAHCRLNQQIRHASLLRRPRKPYTFTQLITLSDGSTFTHRTTSPAPIYRSTKDTKNSPLWNPSSQKLLNVEEDEAGRLRRFRARFGRGFDAEALQSGEEVCIEYSNVSRG